MVKKLLISPPAGIYLKRSLAVVAHRPCWSHSLKDFLDFVVHRPEIFALLRATTYSAYVHIGAPSGLLAHLAL